MLMLTFECKSSDDAKALKRSIDEGLIESPMYQKGDIITSHSSSVNGEQVHLLIDRTFWKEDMILHEIVLDEKNKTFVEEED